MASTSTDTSQSSAVSQFLAEMPNPSIQNRKKWPNLARICERYQLSDRAAAAVANSVLVDVGLVTEDDKTRIILIVVKYEESVKDAETKSGAKSNKTLDW